MYIRPNQLQTLGEYVKTLLHEVANKRVHGSRVHKRVTCRIRRYTGKILIEKMELFY